MDNILKVSDLTYSYPGETATLHNVGFSVSAGDKIAIVGGNGAGKTTLFLCLVGILRYKGKIEVDGLTVKRSSLKEIRRKVGFLFADPDDQLFMPTVLEDVTFGLLNAGISRSEATSQAHNALSAFDAGDLANKDPRKLSRGEKKRVALAAVMALKPKFLLADEPASGLDPMGRRSLIETLSTLDNTLLIATHDIELALEVCNRVLIINNGHIASEGIPSELFTNKKVMTENGLEIPYSLR